VFSPVPTFQFFQITKKSRKSSRDARSHAATGSLPARGPAPSSRQRPQRRRCPPSSQIPRSQGEYTSWCPAPGFMWDFGGLKDHQDIRTFTQLCSHKNLICYLPLIYTIATLTLHDIRFWDDRRRFLIRPMSSSTPPVPGISDAGGAPSGGFCRPPRRTGVRRFHDPEPRCAGCSITSRRWSSFPVSPQWNDHRASSV